MSYQKDLDEYTDAELQNELNRRITQRQSGLCDYCGRVGNTPACKFPDRHKLVSFWERPEEPPRKYQPIVTGYPSPFHGPLLP